MSSHDLAIPYQRHAGEPVVLYLWGAENGHGRTVLGVTDQVTLAHRRMLDAIEAMPGSGTSGIIQIAHVDLLATPYPQYAYRGVLIRVRRGLSGALITENGGRSSACGGEVGK